MTDLLDLPAEEAHVWLVRPDDIRDEARLGSYRALLSDDERERYQRFHFDRHRHLFLVSRALVRTTLSRYLGGAPASWTFETNEYGRPELAAVHEPAGLRFNLSHARGLAGIVVTRSVDCGFDVEDVTRLEEPLALIERFFAAPEVTALRALEPAERQERFFRYWTLKESYIKARGMGLAISLGSFWFMLDGEEAPRIDFGPDQGDDPASWQFHSAREGDEHFLAVALRASGEPFRITISMVVPGIA